MACVDAVTLRTLRPREQGKTHSYQTPEEVTSDGSEMIAPIRRPKGQGKPHSFPTPEEVTSSSAGIYAPSSVQRLTANLSCKASKP